MYECVPNFSEGTEARIITALVSAVETAGVAVCNRHSDPAYNRTVLTFLDTPQRVSQAAFNAIAAAAQHIDMRRHRGAHPRLGATDVCPLVALPGTAESQCIRDLHRLAQRVADELDLCVYVYGKAALRPERRLLSDIRRGEFEAWHSGIGRHPRWEPDWGRAVPRACGPVVLGVRPVLIAINFVLDTDALPVARHIARCIRSRAGGLAAVQARGFAIQDRVHVSCNLLDYRVTGPRRVFCAIETLARKAGTAIRETEIVGLIPRAALADEDRERMKIRMLEETVFLDYWLQA